MVDKVYYHVVGMVADGYFRLVRKGGKRVIMIVGEDGFRVLVFGQKRYWKAFLDGIM